MWRIVFVLAPIACLAQSESGVVFDATHHVFGKIPDYKITSHRYVATNLGTSPINIIKAVSSCGCSITDVEKTLLNPGESGYIKVVFNPWGLAGPIRKAIEIVTDDPIKPRSMLTFEAYVYREIIVSETAIFFDKIPRNISVSRSIKLESGNSQPVVLSGIQIENAPYLSCKTLEAGNDVILTLTLDSQLISVGHNKGLETMIVRTTNQNIPEVQFRIQWDIQVPIVAAPGRIAWVDNAGTELSTSISLFHSGSKPFKILGAKATSPLITISGIGKASAVEHKIEIHLSPTAQPGSLRETLTLTLNDPEQEELEISIMAILQ